VKRKISAILAADVAGYSRLVAEDEEETIRRLASYREVFDDFVTRCGGRIFNTAGDAVLAEFPSAVEAVRCAVDVQEGIRTRNLAYPSSRHMSFRMGITIGDVIEREGDLLGDGVNIAARLEGLATPGGICVSSSVFEQVRNKVSVTFEDIGNQRVKNIPDAIHAYVVAFEGAPSGHRGKAPRRFAVFRPRWLAAGTGLAAALALILAMRQLSNAPQMPAAVPKPASVPAENSGVTKQADFGPVAGPFDGLWEVALTGNDNCVYQRSDFRISIRNGDVLYSTPERGNVEPTGDFHFTTPSRANPNLTVRYIGRLSGNAGEGTYQVLGSKCGGSVALKRFE